MTKMKSRIFLSSVLLLAPISWPFRTFAHGVLIDAAPIQAFQVQVRYESGDPMVNAQVNVYAPNNPQTVWLQTVTDEQGSFLFTPDPNIVGTWDIQARLAGHGELLQIDVQEDGSIRQLDPSRETPLQKWLTIVAVVWGFVGTALFFSNRHRLLQNPTHSGQSPSEHSARP